VRIRRVVVSMAALLLACELFYAQKNNNQTGNNPSQVPSSAGSSSAQGITWPRSAWDHLADFQEQEKTLQIPISKDHALYLLCYSLDVTTGSLSTPPFVFRQIESINGMKGRCIATAANAKKPLIARSFLGVAVDARHVPTDRMRSFNLSLSTAAGQPINLYPVRPSFGATSPASSSQTVSNAGGAAPATWGKIYYLIWPQELGGDVIPTVTLSLTYTPPVPGSPWQSNTVYPEGSIVTPIAQQLEMCSDEDVASPKAGGHYFVAHTGGISFHDDNTPPKFCVQGIKDGTVWWVDAGTTSPPDSPSAPTTQGSTQKVSISLWGKDTQYDGGSTVYSPLTGHYYVAQKSGGKSGDTLPFSPEKTLPDGTDLSWAIFGRNPPPVGDAPAEWDSNQPYKVGQTVYDPRTQLYFTAVITPGKPGGQSGSNNPFGDYMTALRYSDPAAPAAGTNPVMWLDVGSSTPLPSNSNLPTPTRKISTEYALGEVVFDPGSQHFFTAIRSGRSSAKVDSTLVANQHATVADHYPVLAVLEDFLDSTGKTPTGEWNTKRNPNADPACNNLNTQSTYPSFDQSTVYQNNNCILDTDSSTIFQLTKLPKGASVIPAVPENFSFNKNSAKPIHELFLDEDEQLVDLTWKPNPGAKNCANLSLLTYSKGDCIDSASKFQLDSKSTGPFTRYPQENNFSAVAQQLTHIQADLAPIAWEDLGTSIPSSVSAGGEPADQTVAQAFTLTQVHPKYYFNISTGLVASTTHSHSFGWATNAPGLYTPIQTASNPIIDPVLFLTLYWPTLPMDAESPWRWKDAIPAPTFGMSFTSPTSNFYAGFSSEMRRNIQIVFGMSTAEPQYLSSTSVSASNTGNPPTAAHFTRGGFVGFSLNISGFIQTALGGK
jgi:hypothetical protein